MKEPNLRTPSALAVGVYQSLCHFLTVTQTIGQTAGHTDVSIWYLLEGYTNMSYQFDREEFNQIRWFSSLEVPYERSEPYMKRCLEKYHLSKTVTSNPT